MSQISILPFSAICDKLGDKSRPGLPVSSPYALSLSIAGIAENVMGGCSGGVGIIIVNVIFYISLDSIMNCLNL